MTDQTIPILKSPLIGYAHHRIILDETGKPCDYEFLEVNPTFEKLIGIPKENLIGHTVRQAIPDLKKTDFDWIGSYRNIVQSGGKKTFEQFSESLNRWYRVQIFSSEEGFFTTLFVDITESKNQAEELEGFFMVNLDLLCIADLDGHFIKTSEAWKSTLGYTTEELNRKKFLDLVHPDDLPATLDAMAALGSGQDVLNFINRYRCKNGSYRSIEWRSHPKGNLIYAAARDITERRQAEEILRQSEERFRSIIAVSNTGAWEYHRKPDYLWCSPEYFTMLGRDPGHYVMDGRANLQEVWLDLLHPEDRDRAGRHFTEYLEKGSVGLYENHFRMQHADGSWLWIWSRGQTLRNPDGSLTDQTLGTHINVTERKKAEEALLASEAAVRNKLKAILEPQSDFGDLELADIIDVQSVQSLMENFHHITGIGGSIIDKKGKVLVGVGWQDICTKFHRCHPETLQNCVESDTILTSGVTPGRFKTYRCKNGMLDMASPIEISGRHLGNIFFGQFIYADTDQTLDVQYFRSQARRYGFDEAEYLAALTRVPRYSRKTVHAVMTFYTQLAEMISSLSFSNVSLARTITERKQVEDALRASEAKLSALYASMTEMVVLHELVFDEAGSPVNYRITDCNAAFTQVTGIHREDAVGKLASEVYGTPEPPYLTEYTRVGVTGKPCHFETFFPSMDKFFSISAVSPAQNQFATITTDITEARRAQAVIDEKNRELEQIVYVASHDLRSPLVNVDGYSRELEYALQDLASALEGEDQDTALKQTMRAVLPDMGDSLSRIRAGTRRMDALLKGLLKLSRSGRAALTIENLDMNQLLDGVVSSIEFQVTQMKATLSVGELPACRGDAVQVVQVFANLLDNALKYHDHDQPVVITVTGASENDRSVYCVEDNGIGIAEPHREKIFELFHRLDPSQGKGDGLGLTITRQALGRMDGDIRVESEPGVGSRFYVTLPSL